MSHWESLVLDNGLIRASVVPAIGARIMAFDLGDYGSIWVNEARRGAVWTPHPGQEWPNFGGFKNWPAPQTGWNWPPPPMLDHGRYEAQITRSEAGAQGMTVSSPVEQWGTPGLRFERRIGMMPDSSVLTIEQTLINEGDAPQRWSVWDISQHIARHPGADDYAQFCVYFPVNPASRYSGGVRVSHESRAWEGEVAPGVFGVRFLPENKKIFADSHEGWIAYVDEREQAAYVKLFEVFPGAEYPDDGARVEVWLNRDPVYLEVEVLSPLVALTPRGGRYTFVEQWGAARTGGPVLGANRQGVIAQRLRREAGTLTGRYGVFDRGRARAVFLGADGAHLGAGQEHAVTPLAAFDLREAAALPPGTAVIELQVNGGVLDRYTVE